VQIFSQLGELFLEALPTTIIVFLFFLFLRWAFFGPMERVLAERSKRIEGARKEADAAQVAAQEKVRHYQEALKKARGELYAEQDAARRAVLDERTRLIKQTRDQANDGIRVAKDKIAGEVAAARKQLEQDSQTLGSEIARAILRTGPSAPAAGGSR
jgi:F0F1-type ATP synthase membrane subunit b/b'